VRNFQVRAIIINIGDELTLGYVLNSNGAYLAREVLELGCEVRGILALPDRVEIIEREIERALEEAEIVLITGGLGPTDDDRTREAIARAVGRRLVENEEAMENVRQHLVRYRKCMDDRQRKQAFMPEGAKVFTNPYGSAAGFACKLDGKTLIAMPGVPRSYKKYQGGVA